MGIGLLILGVFSVATCLLKGVHLLIFYVVIFQFFNLLIFPFFPLAMCKNQTICYSMGYAFSSGYSYLDSRVLPKSEIVEIFYSAHSASKFFLSVRILDLSKVLP